jgi:glycosyltransferase involved in cell wall biosynthesis
VRINLSTPINQLGYGIAGLNILDGLVNQGHDVALFPYDVTDVPANKSEIVGEAIRRAERYSPEAPSIKLFMADKQAEHAGRKQRVAFPFFELTPLKQGEIHHLNQVTNVCVASAWGKKVAEDSGVTTPVHVIPMGVDRTIFSDSGSRPSAFFDTCVFFNVGKWEVRKGHDILLSAFNKAFVPTDNVLLRMLCMNPFDGFSRTNEDWRRLYMSSEMGASGHIDITTTRFTSQNEVAAFMMMGDCGVFPARAEGWNLDLLECLSVGKYAIATDYSGHTEFVTTENCRLIEVSGLEPAIDGKWFDGAGEWAHLGESQEEQLIENLRAVFRSHQESGPTTNVAGVNTAEKFSWTHTATKLLEVIQ